MENKEGNAESEGDSQLSAPKKQRKQQKSYRKKVEREWSHENTLKLIKEIERRRSLWDVGCFEYKLPKETCWQEVADAINTTRDECKGKWSNLRTTFNCNLNKYRKSKLEPTSNETVFISWKYYKLMMFLESNKNLQSTQPTSSVQLSSDVDDNAFMHDFGECEREHDIPSPKETKKRLRMRNNDALSTPLASSPDTSQASNLNQMPVRTPDSYRPQNFEQKNPSTALCDYMAAELQNLTPEQATYARSQMRRAFNDIMDQVTPNFCPFQESKPEPLLLGPNS